MVVVLVIVVVVIVIMVVIIVVIVVDAFHQLIEEVVMKHRGPNSSHRSVFTHPSVDG